MENQTKLKGGLDTLALYNVAFVVSNIDESINWYNINLGFKLVMKQLLMIRELTPHHQ
ncbi:hypothetical protein C7447_104126 [Tenacibaculum adriaticum]|uniref:Glyoxalase/bleomycin resistance protein/dioxygenase superfamily protein n=1 Tax=Tenacibaculum adriaticum TaxID=413713 RepID=A0A5S5DNB5_9FLAO|nr:hypothetical protein [Tenacibaculum adriaticum]TYP97440.1 hypothetical protein C7447_104126 [Tenacibaculum adriaticum]